MAKVTSPLLSETASGTVGDLLTFSVRKSGQQVRFQRKQKDVFSERREEVRERYRAAVDAWQLLSAPEKRLYTISAKRMQLTGYNLFLSLYLKTQGAGGLVARYGLAKFGLTIYGRV